MPESAYGTQLAFDATDLLLLTPRGVHRVSSRGEVQSTALELGFHAHVLGAELVYWSEGAFWSRSLKGGKPRLLAKTKSEPSLSSGTADGFSWVERGRTESRLQGLGASGPRVLHRTENAILSLLVHAGHAFFIDRDRTGAWRIGRASLDGVSTDFTQPRSSRPPSMLAASAEALYYYEGLTGGIHELSFDFTKDRVLLTQFVCSPLAAADDVYCASVPGISRLPVRGAPPSLLAVSKDGPITSLTTNGTSLAWVTDLGADRLTLRVRSITNP